MLTFLLWKMGWSLRFLISCHDQQGAQVQAP